MLARWGEVVARCRAARRRQGLRLKVNCGLEAWRCVSCSAVMFPSVSQISLDAASFLGKCPRVLIILRILDFRHKIRVLQASSPCRTCVSSYLNHSDLMRRVMLHPIAKRPVGSCG